MFRSVAAVVVSLIISVPSFAQKEKDKVVNYSDSLLYGGCWFVPHNSGVNIRFTEFSNFRFEDYNNSKGGEVVLKGKYLLDGHNIWLLFDDQPKQKFYFSKGEGADDNYYIKGYPLKTSAYYFVHGDCQ